jgi:hypothetical protein
MPELTATELAELEPNAPCHSMPLRNGPNSIPLRVIEDAVVPTTRAVRKTNLTGACTDRPNPDVTNQNRSLSAPPKTHHADHERGLIAIHQHDRADPDSTNLEPTHQTMIQSHSAPSKVLPCLSREWFLAQA